MQETHFDLIVMGGGSGGYVAALRAAQLGMRVACVEKRPTLGGTCLNIGCIPSKALLHASHKFEETKHLRVWGIEVKNVQFNLKRMMNQKDQIVDHLVKGLDFLFRKNNITRIEGQGTFQPSQAGHTEVCIKVQDHLYTAARFLIATGSEPASLPGVYVDERRIISSTGALSLTKVPKRLVVVGGGYIGLELGSVWARLGAQVTVIEALDTLVPTMDREVGRALISILKNQGLTFKLATQVTHVEQEKSHLKVGLTPSSLSAFTQSVPQKGAEELLCDLLLVAVGRRPYTRGLGLEAIGLTLDARGFIPVNASYQTNIPQIYAIGDVIGGPMLAHKAEEEGIVCVERMAGQKSQFNPQALPGVIYTQPEVAAVGATEEELVQAGIPYCTGKFPFTANSRARTTLTTDGFVKILSHQNTDEILGVHILHAQAGTLIAEAVLAREYRTSSEDLGRTCHAHPTLNEALKEAALSVLGRALHI